MIVLPKAIESIPTSGDTTMKQLAYLLLSFALLTPASMLAQGGPPPGGPGGEMGAGHQMPTVDRQLEHYSRELKLTDAQKPQVKTILEDEHEQMKQVMDNTSASRDESRTKMREIRQASNAKLRALLTDEQKAKFDKMQAEHRDRMGGGRPGADQGAPPPPQQ
jgi:periplasmic protein CpxP/Spy